MPAGNHRVVSEDEDVSLGEVCDYSSLSELMELAVLDYRGALLVVNSGRDGISHTSTPKGAPLDKTGGVRLLVDARSLVLQIVFDALDREGTALEDESSRLD